MSGISEANVIIYPTHCRPERRKGNDMEKSCRGKNIQNICRSQMIGHEAGGLAEIFIWISPLRGILGGSEEKLPTGLVNLKPDIFNFRDGILLIGPFI